MIFSKWMHSNPTPLPQFTLLHVYMEPQKPHVSETFVWTPVVGSNKLVPFACYAHDRPLMSE